VTGTTIDVMRRGRRRRLAVIAGAVVLVAVGATGAARVIGDDPGVPRTEARTDSAPTAPADDDSADRAEPGETSATGNGTVVVRAPTVRTAVLPGELIVDRDDDTPAPTTSAPAATDEVPDLEPDAAVQAAPPPAAPIAPPSDPEAAEPLVEVGTIRIPKLGIDETMYSGIRLSTLDHGPGHWPGTALPGEVGNVVVAGHRTSHGAPFRHIDTLVAGDEVRFTTATGEFTYRVIRTRVVEPDAVWIVDPTPTPTATLFACHPPGSVSQRIVAHLELAE
jgi:sortase A